MFRSNHANLKALKRNIQLIKKIKRKDKINKVRGVLPNHPEKENL